MEYSEHTTELRSKCNLTSKVQEGHEKPIQKEAYEHPAKVVKVTSILPHEVLSPSNYKNLIKVCKIFVALLQKIYGIVLIKLQWRRFNFIIFYFEFEGRKDFAADDCGKSIPSCCSFT